MTHESDLLMATLYGATETDDPDELANVRRITHDQVREMCDGRQCGPVRWLQFNGKDGIAALRKVNIVDPELEQFVAECSGAQVIIAMAPYT